MKIIFDYNRTIFDPETNELYPGVFELLRYLQPNHELFLVSRNEPDRLKRFETFGLTNIFKKVYFVPEKNLELFKKISNNEKNTFVIGDSLNDEIKIGNTLGFLTIRIKQGKFKDVKPTSTDEIPNFELNNIESIRDLIEKYEKN